MATVDHALLSALIQERLLGGHSFYLRVSSNSMAPLLCRGHEVAVEASPPTRLRAGDIIVLDEGQGFLMHRYWGKDREARLITRGDRSLQFDPPWDPERLVGRVVARRGRRTLSLRRGPGARLSAYLGRLAAREQRLLAGSGPYPLASPPVPTYLGRKLREDKRYLPARLLRHAFHAWAGCATFAWMLLPRKQSEESDNAGRCL